MKLDTISVIGLGYIGLPTAAVLASGGRKVIGVDIDAKTVATINRGEIHIVEPFLDALVSRVVADGFLKATSTPEPADAFLLAVPTPFQEDHTPDMHYIANASRSIAPVLTRGAVNILESTSPVCPTDQMARRPDEKR